MSVAKTTQEALTDFVKLLSPTVYKEVTSEGSDLLDLLGIKKGYVDFLQTLGKSTFTKPMSYYHNQFWKWYWRITRMRTMGMTLDHETLCFLAAWARGCGKSSHVEWACITEGAVGLDGYVLYVSLTQDTANKHVLDIRDRIEGENIANTFPHLSEPKMGTHGNRYAWNQEFLVTSGGWAIRPVGLDVAIRGLRLGDIRPTMIVLDDVDRYGASAQLTSQAMETIARSILPAGTPDTVIMFAQNLIYQNSIANQIASNKSDLLSDRITSVVPAFDPKTLVIDTRIEEETGKTSHKIEAGKPFWQGMDVRACQRFLNNSGLEAFYSEYQHDFTLDLQDRVLPEYLDYPTHVISWSQFEEKFGTKNRVPSHWQVGMGLDIGYTSGHLSAWTWIAVASEDSELPYAHFRYRGKTFESTSITDQAEQVHEMMKYTDKYSNQVTELDQIMSQRISHERKGERMLLNFEFDFNFNVAQYKSEDGIPEWRNLLRIDKHQPHPFHEDKQGDDGLWSIGRPNFFDVVDDDQLNNPRNDNGMLVHRAQALNQRRRKVAVTQTGMQDAKPMKFEDDANDSTRMILVGSPLTPVPLTAEQRLERKLRRGLNEKGVEEAFGQEDYAQVLLARQMALRELQMQEDEDVEQVARIVRRLLAPRNSQTMGKSKYRGKL